LSDGTRRWAIPGPAALARRPASRPGQTSSPRRTTGGNPEPSAPRLVNSPLSIRGKDREGCYLRTTPSPTPWRNQIAAPMKQESSTWLYGWKNHCEYNSKPHISLSEIEFYI